MFDINKIAHLARIKLTEKESTNLTIDINSIVGLADRLAEVDTKDINPLFVPLDGIDNLFSYEENQIVKQENKTVEIVSYFSSSEDNFCTIPSIKNIDE